MVDTLHSATETEAVTGLTITEDNLFCIDGKFTEPGLIEHIAQSASALAGYSAKLAGKPTPIGFIGEVKKFHLVKFPSAGDTLTTHLQIISVVGNISMLQAETKVGDDVVCTVGLKIAIE